MGSPQSVSNVNEPSPPDFEVEHPGQYDYVEITDGDGSRLARYSADQNNDPHLDVTSYTETVHVLFHTDQGAEKRGWRLEWSK